MKLLQEYSGIFNLAGKLLMMKEADCRISTTCSCGSGIREVRCLDCDQQTPLCRACWVTAHKYNPLHWAFVWENVKGYFIRHDISTVLHEGYAIPLGYNGEACPKSTDSLLMTIGDHNGIHATKVTFCGVVVKTISTSGDSALMRTSFQLR